MSRGLIRPTAPRCERYAAQAQAETDLLVATTRVSTLRRLVRRRTSAALVADFGGEASSSGSPPRRICRRSPSPPVAPAPAAAVAPAPAAAGASVELACPACKAQRKGVRNHGRRHTRVTGCLRQP